MQGTDTTLNPYLAFNGKCSEATTFYKEALNGELSIQTFGESTMEVAPENKDRVMHATFTFGNAILMASDGPPDHEVFFGNSVHCLLQHLMLQMENGFLLIFQPAVLRPCPGIIPYVVLC